MSLPNQGDVRARLGDIVAALQAAGLWDIERPADAALEEPPAFGGDRMSFEQWLRWVFVPEVEARLVASGPWPDESHVATRAAREGDASPLIAQLVPALRAFDALFAPAPAPRAHRGHRDDVPAARAYRRSHACVDAGDYAGAREAIEACLAADPSYPNAQNFAGWVRLQTPQRGPEDLEAALAHFHEALVVEPEGYVLQNLADALLALGRGEEARGAAEAATDAPKLAAYANNWLAWFHAEREPDGERAVRYGRRAVELRPRWGTAWLNLGRACDRAGDALGAYQAYLDALACGDAHDEAFVERRTAMLASALVAGGTPAAAAPTGPARDRVAGLEAALRALIVAVSGLHPGLHLFGAAGEPVPEGDVPFGSIGTVADGRIHVHALVSHLGVGTSVAVLAPGPRGPVLRSVFMRDDAREAAALKAAALVGAWVAASSPFSATRLTPLDAAVASHAYLFGAVPGWRLRLTCDDSSARPDLPTTASIESRRFPGSLALDFLAHPDGGVTARGMHEGLHGPRPEWRLPAYAHLVPALPAIAAACARAFEAFAAFRARPLPVAVAATSCVEALRGAALGVRWESVANDDTYPWSWPNAFLRAARGSVDRVVVNFAESAAGVAITVRHARFVAASLPALEALLPAIVDAARAELARFTVESFVAGGRYRVREPLEAFAASERVVLVALDHYPKDGGDRYELASLDRPGVKVVLWSASQGDDVLGAIDRYLEPLG